MSDGGQNKQLERSRVLVCMPILWRECNWLPCGVDSICTIKSVQLRDQEGGRNWGERIIVNASVVEGAWFVMAWCRLDRSSERPRVLMCMQMSCGGSDW